MNAWTRVVSSLLAALLVSPSRAWACTCVPPTTNEKVARSQIVILGRLLEASSEYAVPGLPDTTARDLTVAVEEVLKSTDAPRVKGMTLKVQGFHSPCGGGKTVAPGELHLWFLRVDKPGSTPTTVIDGCPLVEAPENLDRVRAELGASPERVGP